MKKLSKTVKVAIACVSLLCLLAGLAIGMLCATSLSSANQVLTVELVLCLALLIFMVLAFLLYAGKAKKQSKNLQELACRDSLTGTSNYQKFCQDCDEARNAEPTASFAIVSFDIDHFRMINDTFGYAFGDKALIYIADSLKNALGNDGIYCRMAADTFLVFLKATQEDEHLKNLIKVINDQMGNICIAGLYINLKPSFGIYISADAKTDIRTCADGASLTRKMVKSNDNIQFAYFDQNLQGLATEEAQTQTDLECAIDRHELQVYYQPQLSFKTGEIVGMEALLRWKHPKKGYISPSYFIPIAEKSGLIFLVGRFAFEQTCRDLQAWQQRNKYMHVSFNLSRMELYQTNLIGFLKETMEKYGVDPNQIEIELTEATTVDDLTFICDMIQQLKSIGIQVALSDFGTGYSSLSTLETLKFDVLKLSRTFLGELTPQKKNTITAMVNHAKALGFSVIAECVETQEEVDFLTSVGCDIAQGFYYTKPMPKAALEAFVFGTPTHKKIMLTDVFAR